MARLRAVAIRTEDGQVTDVIDIRRPVRVEMEYDVLKSGYVLLPYFDFHSEAGVCIFGTCDLDPAWRQRPRPQGRWVSTVLVPGNFLAEETMFVSPGLLTLNPIIPQFAESAAVAFQVVDSLDGDSARGDWTGKIDGLVRPLLDWSTQSIPVDMGDEPNS